MPHDLDGIDEKATRQLAQAFLIYWSVQDVAQTVALLARDIVSVVHLSDTNVGMNGTIIGIDAIEEGLFRNLKTWHYLKFDGHITRVIDDLAVLQIEFEYEHQTTKLRHAGTMRKHLTVRRGQITRVEAFHDGKRVEAYLALVRQRETETIAARDAAQHQL